MCLLCHSVAILEGLRPLLLAHGSALSWVMALHPWEQATVKDGVTRTSASSGWLWGESFAAISQRRETLLLDPPSCHTPGGQGPTPHPTAVTMPFSFSQSSIHVSGFPNTCRVLGGYYNLLWHGGEGHTTLLFTPKAEDQSWCHSGLQGTLRKASEGHGALKKGFPAGPHLACG